jgi:hypothetical protein
MDFLPICGKLDANFSENSSTSQHRCLFVRKQLGNSKLHVGAPKERPMSGDIQSKYRNERLPHIRAFRQRLIFVGYVAIAERVARIARVWDDPITLHSCPALQLHVLVLQPPHGQQAGCPDRQLSGSVLQREIEMVAERFERRLPVRHVHFGKVRRSSWRPMNWTS